MTLLNGDDEQAPPVLFHIPRFDPARHVEIKSVSEAIGAKWSTMVITVMTGLGGVGKSETAKSLVHQAIGSGEHELVCWFSAASVDELMADYRQFVMERRGWRLESEEMKKMGNKDVWLQVNQLLTGFSSFLLVFDNADDHIEIPKWLPNVDKRSSAGGGQKVLLTTRKDQVFKSMGVTPSIVRVGIPSVDEAMAMLQKRAGRSALSFNGASVNEVEERKAAAELIEEVGRLPLAVCQLGAFLGAHPAVSIGELLARWRAGRQELMARNDMSSEDSNVKTVWITLKTMLDSIVIQSCWRPTMEKVLLACSLLASDHIRGEMLVKLVSSEARQVLEDVKDSEWLGAQDEKKKASIVAGRIELDVLVRLGNNNLLSFDDNTQTYFIHRLVQQAIELLFGLSRVRSVLADLVSAVNRDFWEEADDVSHLDNESRRRSYLPHVDKLLQFCVLPSSATGDQQQSSSAASSDSRSADQELKQAAQPLVVKAKLQLMRGWIFSFTLANYSEAKTSFEEALSIFEKAYGPYHRQVATTLGNLGAVYRDLGEYEKAKEMQERALSIQEKAYGADHTEVAATLGNLGSVYSHLGEYEKAKRILERTLSIFEKAYGADHTAVAPTLGNLGSVYIQLGEYEKAKGMLERALSILEKAYGADHTAVAPTLGNLGSVFIQLGEYEKAKRMLERALCINEKAYEIGRAHV